MSQFQNDAIFWVEVGKIRPNPYQPRTEFDEAKLKDLSDSIRQYGILQPLVVTRHEEAHTEGISTYYELIAGERRLRASKLAGLSQVPVIIRTKEEENRVRLELAIIENLQREDLNAIDRARAFDRLQKEFGLTNTQIAEKVGKSREYVSNSIRLLSLPQEMQQAVMGGAIYEGHARALLMLSDRPDEQKTVFRDILVRKLSVRDVEQMTRQIATEKARKKESPRPEIEALERAFAESLGTKVEIKEQEGGGKLIIDFFSTHDLQVILAHIGNPADVDERAVEAPVDPLPADNIPADESFSADYFSI
ncbi:MAG: ParB/RepB/Spo0J family partition protein [Patescibacteria group bacterium]|nr:ParB/RepB/Spo0J family partition protein [Patescibacteria group bacterium]